MRLLKRIAAGLGAAVLAAVIGVGASAYTLTPPSISGGYTFPAAWNDLMLLEQQIVAQITAQSTAQPSTPRNLLDNGNFAVAQAGTAATAGGTTSGCGATVHTYYPVDRWCVDTNVGSGAGYGQVTTSSPTPPVGSINQVIVYRNSGALTQPVCFIQEVGSATSAAMQGQQVVLSAYLDALAGLGATNVTWYVISGTATDEGLGTMTASPAVTPAWTGLATDGTGTWAVTTTYARYVSTAPVTIPSGAKEVGVEICFTPGTETAGATDGIAVAQAQLEISAGGASPFEFHVYQQDLAVAQRYYWQFSEAANSYNVVPGICSAQSSTVATCNIPLKVSMRVAPTTACTYGTMKRMVGGTETALTACAAAGTTNGVSTTDAVEITATVGSGDTAGYSGILQAGHSTGGGLITASADF